MDGGTCHRRSNGLTIIPQNVKKGKRKGGKYLASVKKTDNPNYSRRKTPPKVSELKIRLSVEDEVIIERVREKYGLKTKADALRLGIRELDKKKQ